jgi:hypothetical protein
VDKIASPQDLVLELRRILSYCEGFEPSREKLAQELSELADHVCPYSEPCCDVPGQAPARGRGPGRSPAQGRGPGRGLGPGRGQGLAPVCEYGPGLGLGPGPGTRWKASAADPYKGVVRAAGKLQKMCAEILDAANKGYKSRAQIDNLSMGSGRIEAQTRLLVKALKKAEGYTPPEKR